MKRRVAVVSSLCLALWWPIQAQVDVEDVRRLNGTVESLTEGQESMRRQLQELRDAVIQLRQENTQLKQQLLNSGEFVTREQLKELVKSIQMVDDKRSADADFVRRQLEDIARDINKTLAAPPPEKSKPAPRTPAAPPETVANLPDKQYVHKVGTGETLGAIISAYNKEYGLKVKVSDVLAANPTLKDPKRILVGQELNIPAVK